MVNVTSNSCAYNKCNEFVAPGDPEKITIKNPGEPITITVWHGACRRKFLNEQGTRAAGKEVPIAMSRAV
jgi:hypothetical protein